MWVCPICNTSLESETICPECGFDHHKDMIAYRTLSRGDSNELIIKKCKYSVELYQREFNKIHEYLEVMEKKVYTLDNQISELKEENLRLNQKIKQLNYSIGDVITFGKIGKKDLEWIVLDISDGKLLLITNYGLNSIGYEKQWRDTTWETCSLRKWLNSDFYKKTFNEKEKNKIVETLISADPNPDYEINPGNDTSDKLFLLSIEEVNRYFELEEDRICKQYGAKNMKSKKDNWKHEMASLCTWWLRSPGGDGRSAAYVDINGTIDTEGMDVSSYDFNVVRPSLWLSL